MERLQVKYNNKGYYTLCFPCNQFGKQEPWSNDKIYEFVYNQWPKLLELNGILFDKICVNGDDTHPVYKYLKGIFPGKITWNFHQKWVINRDGTVIKRFDKWNTWSEIEECIAECLKDE
mmetsp:Transcript_30300/g.37156  ORF Transcript_30300/g.37156 Transcript_30300/m.37156 type:complete len:119 (+) Transcript_30300:267-623(+)